MKRPVIAAAVLAITACKDPSTGPSSQIPTAVAISAPQTTTVVGSTFTLTASVFDQAGKRIPGATVDWSSDLPNVASVSASGVLTGVSVGFATIEAQTSGRTASVTITVDPDPCTNPISLQPGQVRMLAGPSAVACVTLAPVAEGSDFLFVTANADQVSDNAGVYSVEVRTANITSTPSALRAPVFDPRVALEQQMLQLQDRTEDRIRRQEQALFRRVRLAARDPVQREPTAALSVTSAIAVEGDTITIRVPDINSPNLCTTGYKAVRAAVKKTTAHSTIAQDITAPSTGFTAADFQAIGAEFESLIYPADTLYFGRETDRNSDGRVTILFTPEVNRATPAGSSAFTAGYFWGGDLLKKSEYERFNTPCPQTNEQEIFYMVVPDPNGTINGNLRSISFVRQITRGTVAHEFQHMINHGKRILNPVVDSTETFWLNEALSHLAEELVGRANRGFSDFQQLTFADINSGTSASADYESFFRQNLARYRSWMLRPDSSSPTSNASPSQLAPRGAAWMFLRYAADYHSNGNLKAYLRNIVSGPDIGLRNMLQHSNGAQYDDLLSGWLISQFTDQQAIRNLPSRYHMRSWAVHDVMAGANNNVFPLQVTQLLSGIVQTRSLSGSGNYFRLVRSTPLPQTTFRMQSPTGSTVGFAGARVYVVRVN